MPKAVALKTFMAMNLMSEIESQCALMLSVDLAGIAGILLVTHGVKTTEHMEMRSPAQRPLTFLEDGQSICI